jgi:hypothetical protein
MEKMGKKHRFCPFFVDFCYKMEDFLIAKITTLVQF